jgi:hypothetical protein
MGATEAAKRAMCQFSLVKGDEQYLIRYGPGDEVAAIARMMDWAEDPQIDFDWFDAAVLSRQIVQRIMSRTIGEPQEL